MIVFLLREKTSHRIIDERKHLHGLKGNIDFCGFVHFLFTVPDEINGLCLSGVETRVVVPGRFLNKTEGQLFAYVAVTVRIGNLLQNGNFF